MLSDRDAYVGLLMKIIQCGGMMSIEDINQSLRTLEEMGWILAGDALGFVRTVPNQQD